MRENLDDFRIKSGVMYVYTLGVRKNNDIEILLDGMPKESEDAAEIGELIEVTTINHVAPVLEGETSTSEIVKDPNYGDYLSAFAPILDDSGEVIGILGVDINAEQVGSITNNVIISVLPILIPIIILFMLIALFALFLFIMKTLKPLNDVTWIAGKVADGDIHTAKKAVTKLPVNRKDEIGRLSGSFQHR